MEFNKAVHVKHKRIHYCRNERDVTAEVHSSAILVGICSVLWKCCASSTGYCTLPVQRILIKSIAKESLKSRLFNSANHAVIANTATEIGVLKDRPFIPERHILGLYSHQRIKVK